MLRILKKNYFFLLILSFLIYSAVTIFQSSFIVQGVRYFSLSDDEMIGMRYAYNLVHGHGFVWNPGEHVEGITNPLWVAYMALIHLLPISLSKTSLAIQISATLIIVVTLYFVKKIAALLSNSSSFVIFFSVLFTAFYFPLFNWSVILGTEVSVLTLLLTWSAFLTLQTVKSKKFSPLLFFLLGIGTLVRMDFLIPAIVINTYLLIFDRKNRRKYLILGIPLIVIFLTLQTFFRLWYYHDILPNTYYYKMTGYPVLRRITRGIFVSLKAFSQILLSTNLLLIFAPFAYAYFSKNKQIILLLSLFATQVAYNSYVGGDVWEYYGGANRFVAFAMPLFFISLIVSIHFFGKVIQSKIANIKKQYQIIEILSLFFIFLVVNRANENVLPHLFLLAKPTTVIENQPRVQLANCVLAATKPNAKIAAASTGIVPYLTKRYYVDILGRTDKTLASEAAHDETKYGSTRNKYVSFSPGHNKWDYPYLIKKYRPDVFTEIYAFEYNKQHLMHDYVKMVSREGCSFYVLKNSPNIITGNLKPQLGNW